MTIYIKNSDGSRAAAYQVRSNQPAGSVMKAESLWDEAYLHSHGYSILTQVAAPAVTAGQVAVQQADQEISGIWTEVWAIEDKPLEQYRAEKKSEILAIYEANKKANVTALGSDWRGGMDSTLGIDGAVRIAEQLLEANVTLFPDDGVPVSVTITEGKQIAAAVGVAYQIVFGTKETLLVAIESAADNAALTAIVWP